VCGLLLCRLVLFASINISSINFTIFYVPCYPLNAMANSMDVNIVPNNWLVRLVLYMKDVKVVVHDLTLSTNFKFEVNCVLLKKKILDFMG
jgi:hypothetical protein